MPIYRLVCRGDAPAARTASYRRWRGGTGSKGARLRGGSCRSVGRAGPAMAAAAARLWLSTEKSWGKVSGSAGKSWGKVTDSAPKSRGARLLAQHRKVVGQGYWLSAEKSWGKVTGSAPKSRGARLLAQRRKVVGQGYWLVDLVIETTTCGGSGPCLGRDSTWWKPNRRCVACKY